MRKNIEAQIKFDIQKVNQTKPQSDHSKNGGSGNPGTVACCAPCSEDVINRNNPKSSEY